MQMMKWTASLAFGFATVALATGAQAANDPKGIWLDEAGRGAVEIKDCGKGLCGTVVWVKAAKDKDGCGKQILGDVKSVGGGSWDNGWIYDPERGRKFDLALTPMANGKLQVTGYAGYKFLSQTMVWTKAPADLQRCDGSNEAAAAAPAPKAEAPAAAASDEAEKTVATAEPEADQPEARKPAARTSSDESTADRDDAKSTAPSQEKADVPKDADEPVADNRADDGKKVGGAGNIKIGNLELDKVFTRTKSGKCKVDLPFVKMTFDCEQ